ncbi:acetyl-CoA carboxylase biotin carboxylase subunit [Antarcticimicrobium luteum]|uniref:biotin carboxylase n=1 Tax=Antarcticimicrobium luteum TaxID=2547397 RepID=A0A4R5UVB9_9RHOB|nr:acetyl-CoA carboxylase biotin carboxylase subunit [Antarcticimicrobium luteum]TDK43159.1 acetyl-CoA carboxylase biotin carboxylase subunit [Antarcticimicrobium luteum]
MGIGRLFIANRGEIAVRIIRAAKALGIHTIQAYSEGDTEMLAVRLADEAVSIGPAPARDSYLDIEKVVAAARDSRADAVHPGYGFLSESPEFARALEAAGIAYVGPTADTIERMGDKVAARQAAEAAGVPVVPGSKGRIGTVDEAAEVAEQVGYPVMIKAAAGGGGRGIRIAADEAELRTLAPQAQQEAQAAFGDGGLYLERAVQSPRHIEVQILGDGETAVHVFERECSLQRRRQKVWEEAGAACLDEATRDALCASAVALAKSVNYRGAGTLEYLYDEARNEFYFIEMNTRIQVEHPVSEMITGIDLVQEMIRVCGGEKLSMTQAEITRNGHAIEVRINAEDPHMQFMPWPGKVGAMTIPEGEGIRFDHFLYEGYQIPPFYDSLLGKLIVHAPTREQAIARLAEALKGLNLEGLKTTVPLHVALAADKDVQAGRFHTQWLEPWLAAGNLTAAAATPAGALETATTGGAS